MLTAVGSLQPFLPLKQSSFKDFQCRNLRAYNSAQNVIVQNAWSFVQNFTNLIDAGLETVLQPSKVKQVAPLIKSWKRNRTICQATQEDFESLELLFGSRFEPLENLKAVACVSTQDLARQFPECSVSSNQALIQVAFYETAWTFLERLESMSEY